MTIPGRQIVNLVLGWSMAVLMAVEIRAFLAVGAFRQKPGTVLAIAWMLFLSPAKQVLDSKCKAFGIGFSDAGSIPAATIAYAAKRVSWPPELRGFPSPLTAAPASNLTA